MVLEDTPGILSLLAGKPNASTFPITSFSMTVRSPAPPFTETTLKIEDRRITEALQYGPVIGQTELVEKLFELQLYLHGRKRDPSWRISVAAGGQDVLYKLMQTLTDPGDIVLVEASQLHYYERLIFIYRQAGSDVGGRTSNHAIM